MWPFTKKKVIDLTEKAKIPKSVYDRISKQFGQQAYKDLTSPNESALGFLGNLANIPQASSSPEDTPPSMKHIKIKIDDVEYKIESLRKKIDSLIDRIDLAEKRIDRNDRR